MAKSTRAQLSGGLVTVDKGAAVARLVEKPAPPPEPERVAMTFRITKATHKRLRQAAYEHEMSQQAVVDRGLDMVLAELIR